MYQAREAVSSDGAKIVELFKRNYPAGYYEKAFASVPLMEKLLAKPSYRGFLVEQTSTGEVVGFRGLKLEEREDFLRAYLCNLLVDKAYRGQGISGKVETIKDSFLRSIAKPKVVYGLVIPRTDASLACKLGQGYQIWGVRNFFGEKEPSPVGEGHLFPIGKVMDIKSENIVLPVVSVVSQKLIESVCPVVTYTSQVVPQKVKVVYPSTVLYGQYSVEVVQVVDGKTAIDVDAIISKLLAVREENPYLSLRLNVNIANFVAVERSLLAHQFFPTSFLPYFDFGAHVLEFQYINEERMTRLSPRLANGEEILAYQTT